MILKSGKCPKQSPDRTPCSCQAIEYCFKATISIGDGVSREDLLVGVEISMLDLLCGMEIARLGAVRPSGWAFDDVNVAAET